MSAGGGFLAAHVNRAPLIIDRKVGVRNGQALACPVAGAAEWAQRFAMKLDVISRP